MEIIEHKDILTVENGVIVHQANCQNVMGAGVALAIIKKYPLVAERYHALFKKQKPQQIYGGWQAVPVTPTLTIINSFSQFNYGNGQKNGVCYTNHDFLIRNLERICNRYAGQEIWIPYLIGCGLAGGNWEYLTKRIERLPLKVARWP